MLTGKEDFMKLKKIMMILIVAILVFGNGSVSFTHVKAEENPEALNESNRMIVPYWNQIQDFTTDLSAKGTTLYPYAYVKAIKTSGKIRRKISCKSVSYSKWRKAYIYHWD